MPWQKKYASYLAWKVNGKKFEIAVKKNAISQRVNKMGIFILLCNGNHDWMNVFHFIEARILWKRDSTLLKIILMWCLRTLRKIVPSKAIYSFALLR